MEREGQAGLVRLVKEVIDTVGVEQRRAPLDAVNLIALADQELGEIGPVLSGNAGDQCGLCHRASCLAAGRAPGALRLFSRHGRNCTRRTNVAGHRRRSMRRRCEPGKSLRQAIASPASSAWFPCGPLSSAPGCHGALEYRISAATFLEGELRLLTRPIDQRQVEEIAGGQQSHVEFRLIRIKADPEQAVTGVGDNARKWRSCFVPGVVFTTRAPTPVIVLSGKLAGGKVCSSTMWLMGSVWSVFLRMVRAIRVPSAGISRLPTIFAPPATSFANRHTTDASNDAALWSPGLPSSSTAFCATSAYVSRCDQT